MTVADTDMPGCPPMGTDIAAPSALVPETTASRSRTIGGRFAALTALLALAILGSLLIGRYPVPPAAAIGILMSKLLPAPGLWSPDMEAVILDVRWPRIVAAVEIGAALAASGAAYQGMFRNPMVSPDILGVTAGAGLGAALAILCSLTGPGVQAAAFGCGLLAVALTYAIGGRRDSDATLVLILAGIIVGTVFTAFISLVKFAADPDNTLPTIVFWLMGSLSSVHADDVYLALLPIGTGTVGLVLLGWRLNVLSFGDEEASALGLEVGRLRILVIACATMVTASAVAIGGIIGLVGLVVPYLGRLLVGPDHRVLLPACVLLGATYLLIVDDLARSLLIEEIPLGILTSLIGAPVFLSLLTRARKAWA